MRYLILALSILSFNIPAVSAHCGKPHPPKQAKSSANIAMQYSPSAMDAA